MKGTVGISTTAYIGDYYERDSGGTVKQYYSIGGVRVAMKENSTLRYLLSDHLGSTALNVSQALVKDGEVRYYAYGSDRYTSGSMATTYRYTGQRAEQGIGLYFYNARWYDPALGRFAQADPTVPRPSDPQMLNRYSYVANNPLKYVDPTGLDLYIVPGAGEGEKLWDDPSKLKEWICAYTGWNDEQWQAFLNEWRAADLSGREALMQRHHVFIFNWGAWGSGFAGLSGSFWAPNQWAIEQMYRDIERFAMKDITLVGHSKGATAVHTFVQFLPLLTFRQGEAPKNAVIMGMPGTLANPFMAAPLMPRSVIHTGRVRTINLQDPNDVITKFNLWPPFSGRGMETVIDTIDQGGQLGHHDWKQHQAEPILRRMLRVQHDRGGGP